MSERYIPELVKRAILRSEECVEENGCKGVAGEELKVGLVDESYGGPYSVGIYFYRVICARSRAKNERRLTIGGLQTFLMIISHYANNGEGVTPDPDLLIDGAFRIWKRQYVYRHRIENDTGTIGCKLGGVAATSQQLVVIRVEIVAVDPGDNVQ